MPERANKRFSTKLVVLPYEELSVEIGVYKGARAGSYKVSGNFGEKDVTNGHVGGRTITRTIQKTSRVGNTITGTKTEIMHTKTGIRRVRETSSETELDPQFLGSESETVQNVKESWNRRTPRKTGSGLQGSKFVIKRKIGGVESTADAGKLQEEARNLWRKHQKMKEIFDELKSVFSSVKIGWSFSADYEILVGDFAMTVGNRWPNSYVESHRVYYIERYVKGGGKIDLFTGKLGAFFGFAVDPWFLPASVEVGGYVNLSATASISGDYDYSWTSPTAKAKHKVEFLGQGKLAAEGGVKANGRVFGYSVRSRLALESQAVLDIKAEVGSDTPFYVETSCRFGFAAANSKDSPVGLRLVGELIFTGWTVRTYSIKPRTLIQGREFWKDKPLIGKKNEGGTWQ